MMDEVLRFKIVGIGRRPMLIQCRTDLLISHSRILLLLLLIVHLESSICTISNSLVATTTGRSGMNHWTIVSSILSYRLSAEAPAARLQGTLQAILASPLESP